MPRKPVNKEAEEAKKLAHDSFVAWGRALNEATEKAAKANSEVEKKLAAVSEATKLARDAAKTKTEAEEQFKRAADCLRYFL